jgi:hypothetical protein
VATRITIRMGRASGFSGCSRSWSGSRLCLPGGGETGELWLDAPKNLIPDVCPFTNAASHDMGYRSLPVVLYGCETWSLTVIEKHKMSVFEKSAKENIWTKEG